ncbi:MFS general substrate transporter [Aureobasidium subglaciale]|nr:MFS general substrate transporter [Aureobasidium subglaciale]
MPKSHSRVQSSHSISEFTHYDEKRTWIMEESYQPSRQSSSRQKMLVYMLLLAEAIMAASLSAQIPLLVASSSSACSDYSSAYIRSLLECAYFFGSTCSIFWGSAADIFGRKVISMLGLVGTLACCLFMGFATSLPGWVTLRFLAGCMSSAIFTSALAMLADLSMPSAASLRTVSCLPLISVCGGIGPLLQSLVRQLGKRAPAGIWSQWPALNGQVACAGMIFIVLLVEAFCLRETLNTESAVDRITEKATLLGTKSEDSETLLSVSVVDSDEEPTSICIDDFLQAPSFVTLLVSFSILSLHSSTFEVLLPHLADSPANMGGMGLPCGLLNTVVTIVKAIAAIGVFYTLPKYTAKLDVLATYRQVSVAFPAIYVLIPFFAMLATVSGAPPVSWAVFSTAAVVAKELFAELAHVLAILLAFSASPNASSAGTGIGLLGLSNLFKALAVGVSGLSYYLSDAYSVVSINAILWALLAVLAFTGSCVNSRLREAPLVGQDIPAELLRWSSVFDAESDSEADV